MNLFSNVLKYNVPVIRRQYRYCPYKFRNAHTDPQRTLGPKTPDLIYIPHILRWLKTKFRFMYLQKSWDPDFSEGAFIYGSIRALCRITDIIHRDQPEQLDGLLTTAAQMKLSDEMGYKLTKLQKQIIQLSPQDIKILVPTAVNFRSNRNNQRWCDIALRSLALKWYNETGNMKLVLVALQTEFVRDYSEGASPEWTISMFDILECTTLQEATSK